MLRRIGLALGMAISVAALVVLMLLGVGLAAGIVSADGTLWIASRPACVAGDYVISMQATSEAQWIRVRSLGMMGSADPRSCLGFGSTPSSFDTGAPAPEIVAAGGGQLLRRFLHRLAHGEREAVAVVVIGAALALAALPILVLVMALIFG